MGTLLREAHHRRPRGAHSAVPQGRPHLALAGGESVGLNGLLYSRSPTKSESQGLQDSGWVLVSVPGGPFLKRHKNNSAGAWASRPGQQHPKQRRQPERTCSAHEHKSKVQVTKTDQRRDGSLKGPKTTTEEIGKMFIDLVLTKPTRPEDSS